VRSSSLQGANGVRMNEWMSVCSVLGEVSRAKMRRSGVCFVCRRGVEAAGREGGGRYKRQEGIFLERKRITGKPHKSECLPIESWNERSPHCALEQDLRRTINKRWCVDDDDQKKK
jgi:hypothetical protein